MQVGLWKTLNLP